MHPPHHYADTVQTRLLALLPKDGTPVTVCQLASTLCVSEYRVTSALFDPYLAHEIDYDIRHDAYSLPAAAIEQASSPHKACASSY